MPPNGWIIVPLEWDPEARLGMTRSSRLAKILPHRFLEQYDRSLYVDANLEINGSLSALFSRLDDAPIAFFAHPEDRTDIYAEADVCIRMVKDDPQVLKQQVARYRALEFDGRASEKDDAIPTGMAMLRRHNDPTVKEAMEKWWSEYLAGSARDQISLPFALRETGVKYSLIKENVRSNEWFNWRPHHKTKALKDLLRAYKQANAVVLHAPGAEERLRHLLVGNSKVSGENGNRLWQRLTGQIQKAILLNDGILGLSPHGAPEIEINGAELLAEKPLALLCDDPALHEAHAVSFAAAKGAFFQTEEQVLASPIYGVQRRLEFERAAKTFIESHPGPKATLQAQDLERGDLGVLSNWLRAQGRATWPIKLRSIR